MIVPHAVDEFAARRGGPTGVGIAEDHAQFLEETVSFGTGESCVGFRHGRITSIVVVQPVAAGARAIPALKRRSAGRISTRP
jgi:hypothetical protein